MSVFWMVACPERHAPAFKHGSHEAAALEAERLARCNPGQHYFVLRASQYCVCPEGEVSQWTQLDRDAS